MKEIRGLVSVAVPCRNEASYIANFLDGIRKQTHPKSLIEVVIADGLSEDNTLAIIDRYQKEHPDLVVCVVENKKRTTPIAFNLAIKNSRGEFVLPIGAHSQLEPGYIAGCIKLLNEKPEADCVGGNLNTLPASDTLVALAIAISLSHPFGTGNAKYRNRIQKGTWVDTVFGAFYRRKIFKKVGLYNEALTRSQDLELNLRIIKAGGKIWLEPSLSTKYFPKATFREIAHYHFHCGFWVPKAAKLTKTPYKMRQYVPFFVFMLGLMLLAGSFISWVISTVFLGLVGLYLATSLAISAQIALKNKKLGLVLLLPIAFFLRHFVFGLGSFCGLFSRGK